MGCCRSKQAEEPDTQPVGKSPPPYTYLAAVERGAAAPAFLNYDELLTKIINALWTRGETFGETRVVSFVEICSATYKMKAIYGPNYILLKGGEGKEVIGIVFHCLLEHRNPQMHQTRAEMTAAVIYIVKALDLRFVDFLIEGCELHQALVAAE